MDAAGALGSLFDCEAATSATLTFEARIIFVRRLSLASLASNATESLHLRCKLLGPRKYRHAKTSACNIGGVHDLPGGRHANSRIRCTCKVQSALLRLILSRSCSKPRSLPAKDGSCGANRRGRCWGSYWSCDHGRHWRPGLGRWCGRRTWASPRAAQARVQVPRSKYKMSSNAKSTGAVTLPLDSCHVASVRR